MFFACWLPPVVYIPNSLDIFIPPVKCRVVFWHAMLRNAIAWWYAFAFFHQKPSSRHKGFIIFNTYSPGSRPAINFFADLFLSFSGFLSRGALEFDSMRFATLSGENPMCPICWRIPIPDCFFTKRGGKIKKTKLHDGQWDVRLPPWSAKAMTYAHLSDVLSSAFGLLVCVRGGGMRCRRVCALNSDMPTRIS